MPPAFQLAEDAKVIGALKPAADAAGRNGRYISVKNAHKVFIVVYVDQGNAATIQIDIDQAKAIAGTGVKAITGNVRIWANQDLATDDVMTRQADALNFVTSAAVKEKQIIIELDPATLDIAGGFDCIRVKTGASNAANITSALYMLHPLRYAGAASPSAVVD